MISPNIPTSRHASGSSSRPADPYDSRPRDTYNAAARSQDDTIMEDADVSTVRLPAHQPVSRKLGSAHWRSQAATREGALLGVWKMARPSFRTLLLVLLVAWVLVVLLVHRPKVDRRTRSAHFEGEPSDMGAAAGIWRSLTGADERRSWTEWVEEEGQLPPCPVGWEKRARRGKRDNQGRLGDGSKVGAPGLKQQESQLLSFQGEASGFLLAVCVGEVVWDRIRCIKTHLVLAAALSRTLLLPLEDLCPQKQSYLRKQPSQKRIELSVDVGHVRRCLGEQSMLTVGELLQDPSRVNFFSLKAFCVSTSCRRVLDCPTMGRELRHDFKEGRDMKGIQSLEKMVEELRVHKDETAIALGDLSVLDDDFWGFPKGYPFSNRFNTTCKLLLRPPLHVTETAFGFINEFLGKEYASIFLPRPDRKRMCFTSVNVHTSCEYFSLRQLALCLTDRMKESGLSILFVASSQRTPEDMIYFSRQLSLQGVTTFSINKLNEHWAHPYALENSGMLRLELEKFVAANARQFFSFSNCSICDHIRELRLGLGRETCWDGEPCLGLTPEDVRLSLT